MSKPPRLGYDDKHAFDAAALGIAVDRAAKNATRAMEARRVALNEVSRVVAPMALDSAKSAEDIYGIGLDALGADLRGVPRDGYGGLFRAIRRAGTPSSAATAAGAAALAAVAPSTARIRKG